MVNTVGSTDDFKRWKPRNMRNHLTVTELCRAVNRTPSRIKQLEREGRIPKPVRVQVGKLEVRLYSPSEVAKIKAYFNKTNPGPKRKRSKI